MAYPAAGEAHGSTADSMAYPAAGSAAGGMAYLGAGGAHIPCGAYLQISAGEVIRLDDIASFDDRYIMLPLDTDRSLLSAFLVKCLWFKAPVTLWLVNRDYSMRLSAAVYRHNLVGRAFRFMLDRVRRADPAADMAACTQLRLISCEPADMPRLSVRDAGRRFAHRHLDRTGV